LVKVDFLTAALADTGVPVLVERVLLIGGAAAVPVAFCVVILDGLREGVVLVVVVVVGFVDCLRAVAVPGTGGFLAAADDMIVY
jgi:hypothetical protein